MIRKGYIIYDPQSIMLYYKDILSNQSINYSDKEILSLVYSISSELDFVADSGNQAICSSSRVIILMSKLLTGLISMSPKVLDKELCKSSKGLQLVGIYKKFMMGGDGNAFKKSILKLLAPFGGECKQYSSKLVSLKPQYDDHFISFMPNVNFSNIDMLLFVKEIFRHFKNNLPICFYIGSGLFLPSGIYIRFHSSKNESDKIYKRFVKFSNDYSFQKTKIICPYQTFFSSIFLSEINSVTKQSLLVVLSSLSKVVLLKKWNQNYKLLVAYNLLNDLKKSVKTNEWDTFINESFIKLLPDLIDNNYIYNEGELCTQRSKITSSVKDIYKKTAVSIQKSLIGMISVSKECMYDLTPLVDVISSIIVNGAEKESFNSRNFSNNNNAVAFNILDFAMSVLGFDNYEKAIVIHHIIEVNK